MRSLLPCLVLLLLLLLAGDARLQQAPHVVPTDPLPPAREKAQFRLPPGFEAQLVAAEPDIRKPLNIAFDDQGRLWVTDTIEYPFPAPPGNKPRDSVKILSDFGPDGRARKITTFADGLNIPIGVLPLPGASPRQALTFSIPHVYRLRDTTGKGIADERHPFYSTFEYRDTHGMTNAFLHGFDGWVHACHGFSNRSTVKGADGQTITMQSGNTYRMRPDGSRLEQYTWGQVNPFGLTIDPLGYFYSADCHSEPIYQLLRGAYYPSFGKPHDGLDFAPRMFTHYKGSTAVCGIAWYAADAYPRAFQGTAFVGDVMTNQIVQFRIDWDGSSPRASQHVFLDSKDRWFRPVDVKLGPDGALYVADFYNRIIGHYEVPLNHPGRDRERGRIWRIVYKGKDHEPAPMASKGDFSRASTEALISDLGHPNLTVRLQATQQLAHRGGKEVRAAVRKAIAEAEGKGADQAHRHVHALWVNWRLDGRNLPALKQACQSKAEIVRVHAQRILAEEPRWTPDDRVLALAGLVDPSAHVNRAAADALGQHPNPDHLVPLLALRHRVAAKDTHLLHVVRMALRNQLRLATTWQRVQLEIGSEKDARAIADVAPGVPTPEAAAFLLGHVRNHGYPLDTLNRFVHHVARYGKEADTRALVTFCRSGKAETLPHQASLVRAVERGTQERGATFTGPMRTWADEVAGKLLASVHEGEVKLGIDLVGQLRLTAHEADLIRLSGGKTSQGIRLAALTALANLDIAKHAATLGKVLADAAGRIETREQVAGLLARANQPSARAQLLLVLPTAPARLQNSIAAGLAGSREGAENLLGTIASGKASARLLQEKAVVIRLEASGLPMLKERLAKLTAGLPAADAKLAALLAARRKGFLAAKPDVVKGQAIYEKSCANCHQIGGKGAKVGPQLDGIGLRGLERLLEDTLDPNRNVDQAFRTTSLTLTSGKTVEGLFLREEGQVLVLADNQGKEVRVGKKDVEERRLSPLSPMPANFAEQVAETDFYHLLAYLLAQKPGKP